LECGGRVFIIARKVVRMPIITRKLPKWQKKQCRAARTHAAYVGRLSRNAIEEYPQRKK